MSELLHLRIHEMCRTSHIVTNLFYICTGCTNTGPSTPVKECREAYLKGCRQDGVYTIDPGCGKPLNVFCDMKNGGWTVFQRRRDGSENFYRNWADYVAGFGNLKREFWLGLDHIYYGMQFTTKDRDNDKWSSRNCAQATDVLGGWSFNSCYQSNLNGRYRYGTSSWGTMYWHPLAYGKQNAMKFTEMKLRPRD